jgi:hypothetical protein
MAFALPERGQYFQDNFHIDSKVPARLLSGPRSTPFDKTTLKHLRTRAGN